jgi:putative membrane protein
MALSVVMLLPRMVVGAHWLSDITVGSFAISLFALGWLLATPLHAILIQLFTPLAFWSYRALDKILAFVTDKPNVSAADLAQTPIFIGKGFCMGSADIIPGVSGGTMALVLGIYERLLKAISAVDRVWLRDIVHLRLPSALARNDLLFIMPLGIGILSAIIFFTKIVPLPALVLSHPEIIYGLFFGLILASVFVLLGEVENYRLNDLFPALAGIVLGLTVVNLVPVETPTAGWFLFLCGFVAICAMLLPGISGSFILLILGKYAYIINALGEFNLSVIVIFSAGALSGLLAFSKFIIWLLAHHHRNTLLVIKGILVGSLWVIWPFQERLYETVRGKEKLISSSPVWPPAFDSTVVWSVGLMLTGFALVVIIEQVSRRSMR